MSIKFINWDITPKSIGCEHFLELNQYAPTPIHVYNGANLEKSISNISAGFYAKFPGTFKKPAKNFFVPVGSAYNPNFVGGDPATDWSLCRQIVLDGSLSVISYLDQDRRIPIVLPSNSEYDEKIVFLSFLADVIKDKYFRFNINSQKNARYLRLEFGCNSKVFSAFMMIHFFGVRSSFSNIIVSYRDYIKTISWEGISDL